MSQRSYVAPPRDRSPARQFDRRSSTSYQPLNTASSYRPSNEGTQPPVDRPVPSGPRADSFRRGIGAGPRARGAPFNTRGVDSWDRDRDRERDSRDPPSTFRRDDNRTEWSRRDDRTAAFGRDRSFAGRERSASPGRPRRDSKESLTPTFNRLADSGPSHFSATARGGSDRGRGRGGWDRSGGRTSFIGERDRELFPNRSRSRDEWRDRDFDRPRNFGSDADRGDRFERREYDRPLERDVRARDHDIWQRDQSPGRNSTGNRAQSPGAVSSISQDRKLDWDSRKSLNSSVMPPRDSRRDGDGDYFSARTDSSRREPVFSQPPAAQSMPQSSALGLDYGPPPSAPATAAVTPATPATEKPTQQVQLAKAAKAEQPPSVGHFQPPIGPKAERPAPLAPSGPQSSSSTSHSDVRPRAEPSRGYPPYSEHPYSGRDHDKGGLDSGAPRAPPPTAQLDRPLPANVPSGPRFGSSTPYKQKTSPVVSQSPMPPVQPKALGQEPRPISNVPTGPRSASILPPSGPRGASTSGQGGPQSGPASASWRRPQIDYRPQKPSIMGGMNRPHMTDRQPLPSTHLISKQSPKQSIVQLADVDKATGLYRSDTAKPVDTEDRDLTMADIEMSAPASEDDDGDEELDSELDENYFADQEKSHAREIELLKAKMPLPLLADPIVVRLLVRIQILGMICDRLVPDDIHALKENKDIEMHDEPLQGLLSPKETPPEDSSLPALIHPRPRGRPLKEAPVNPIPTPPIEDLPFRHHPAVERVVFEGPVEDEVEEEKVTTVLRTYFEQQAWEEKDDLVELSDFYRQKFPEWRYELDKFERVKRELERTPDPASPGAQSSVSIPPSVERLTGRAARNATEFDIEKAILMSQQSAREEEERREREAASNARPNYDSEAVVPDMLKPTDRDISWRFEDANSFVPTNLAVELMQYIPPEDDFNEDEQSRFITAFCQTPKKWGLIADQIPGRTYQECIAHYYLTKNEANYKEIWRRSQPKKRRGRGATKPRSTALLSDMALNDDPELTPVPVTDSGRPRRAAAPTFGDVPDAEIAGLPAAKRLAATPKDAFDQAPKAAKGRKAGTATKIRRTKAQIQADNDAAAAQQNSGDLPLKVAGKPRQLLTKPNSSQIAAAENRQMASSQNMAAGTASVRQRSPPPPVVTSYWSVPETQKFRQLVGYYGRDYAKIAEFMKTKSQAMIKNQYTREISKPDNDLERIANLAEERIARGEPLGKLPSPILPPKRKYEQVSMASSGRPPSANTEAMLEAERASQAQKGSLVDDFPPNIIHRDANGSIVAKPSPHREILHHSPLTLPVQAKVEELTRERPGLGQKGMSGPQRGHFMDDSFHSHSSRHQPTGNDQVPPHHPPQLVDLRAGDYAPVSTTRDLLAQSRDQIFGLSGMSRHSGLEHEKQVPSRLSHSRNSSLVGIPTTLADQQTAEALAAQTGRSRLYGISSAQSPRAQAATASIVSKSEPYSHFSHQNLMHQQPISHAPQQTPTKQEPSKPPAAKRSNVFDLLSNDEPPAVPLKRSSTDSIHRPPLQTPPPQPISTHSQSQFQHREEASRSAAYSGAHQPQNRQPGDLRAIFSHSPVPSREWIDKFDPRDPRNSGPDRNNTQSPYPSMPPAPASSAKVLGQSPSDGLRHLDPNDPRRSNLSRGHISSPPRQVSTPVLQFRSTSTAPSQHNRMHSHGYSQSGLAPDHRGAPHSTQSGQQPLAPAVSHAPSVGGTPISSLHHRGHASVEHDGQRMTIQQYKAHNTLDQPRDAREALEHRNSREETLRASHEQHLRSLAPPPSQNQEHQGPSHDHRDLFRQEPSSHQVPPPPQRISQLGQLSAGYGPPPRTYTSTPPLQAFSNGDHRPLVAAHNQHAHQHHHSLSLQPPSQQQQQHHHHHHQQQQQQQQQHSPYGQPLAPHNHQQQQQPISQHSQQYREQPLFGKPGPPQGLAPPQSHFRQYSQGGEERR